MPVGGSRHYDGGGLGSEAGWKCPACGAENMGAIAQGCQFCGSGKPGRKLEDAPPPPPQLEPPQDEYDVAARWAERHPDVSAADAYRAGYWDGIQAARSAQRAPEPALDPESKTARTIIAALHFFSEQVLVHAPEEVASGEWLSVAEVRALIQQLVTTGEAIHA